MTFGSLVGVKIGMLVIRCTVEFANKDSVVVKQEGSNRKSVVKHEQIIWVNEG